MSYTVRFFDLEATGLTGGFGRLLSYSAADLPARTCGREHKHACVCRRDLTTFRRDRKPWKGGPGDDRALAVAIRDHLEDADLIVGWNSSGYDVPMLNARLTAHGERPLRSGKGTATLSLDLMRYVPRIGGRKLDTVSKFYGSPHRKTELDAATWARAAEGDTEATDSIVEHNEWDSLTTRDLWKHLAPFVRSAVTFELRDVYHVLPELNGHH